MNFKNTLQSFTPRHFAREVIQFTCSYPILIICLVIGLVWDHVAPSLESLPEIIQGFYAATFKVGLVCLVLDAFWQCMRIMVFIEPNVSPITSLVDSTFRMLERWAFLSLGLTAIRAYGTELFDLVVYAKANPDYALSFIAAIVVLRIVYAMVPQRQIAATRSGEILSAAGMPRRTRSPQEIHRTALHEAGHLVLFGIRGELPEGLKVEVFSELGSQDKYRGLVKQSEPIPNDSVRTEADLHWLMLMQLAGLEAEHVVLGERANGGIGDHRNWLQTATEYLTSGFGEVFYAGPEGEAQREHNRAVLNDLKVTMTAAVRHILEHNKPLLEELTQAIVINKSMERDALLPYLSRVSMDAKCTVPSFAQQT